MTYAECFAGIGGWSLGLQACGWELKWQCEYDDWCRRLLAQRFGVPIYKDIRTICDESPPYVDALIGSPPCQPFSVAGAQGGLADERHLYPSFIKLVAQIQPQWVLMEQVPAILAIDGGRAFAGYLGGLAALGYDIVWHCIPACAVGANHERDRVWILANLKHERLEIGRRACDAGPKGADRIRIERAHKESMPQQAVKVLSNPDTLWKLQQERSIQDKRRWIGDGNWWQSEPNVGRVAYGVPDGPHRLKGLGNAVVPQIPHLIGQAINQIEGN